MSQEQAADMLNVSLRSVHAAAKVQQAGVPELAAVLDAGAVSVSTTNRMLPLSLRSAQLNPRPAMQFGKVDAAPEQGAAVFGLTHIHGLWAASSSLPAVDDAASMVTLYPPELKEAMRLTKLINKELQALLKIKWVAGHGG